MMSSQADVGGMASVSFTPAAAAAASHATPKPGMLMAIASENKIARCVGT